jgi:hypothetical protein
LPDSPCAAIEGLRCHPAFTCGLCDDYQGLTRSEPAIRAHVSKEHKQKPAQQTFFAETQHIRYFVVVGEGADQASGDGKATALEPREQDFFKLLDEDAAAAELDAKAEANIVHGFGSHRSAIKPWLRRTGIEEHRRGLRKDEMHASDAVPKSADVEPELFLMLEVMDEIRSEAHGWCFDGPECMLTWPRQLALSRFHTASTGKALGFNAKKEPATLKTNFGYWKQFLTYCYRVAYCGGHFTCESHKTQESMTG